MYIILYTVRNYCLQSQYEWNIIQTISYNIFNISCIHCLPLVPVPVVSLNNIQVTIGNTATFTCTITVSNLVDNNDLNGLSLVSTTFSPSGGKMNTPSQNGRVFAVQYTISNVNTSNAGVYTCQTMIQHSDSNILTSSTGNDTGFLQVSGKSGTLIMNTVSVS